MIILILKILFPIFFTIFIGWFAGYKDIIDRTHTKSIVNFILIIATPALLLSITLKEKIDFSLNYKVVIIMTLGLLLTYTKTYLLYHYKLKKHPKEATQASLISAFPNAAFMGIPIILKLYDKESINIIIIGSLSVFLLITPLSIFLINYHNKDINIKTPSLSWQVLELCKNPLIYAPILGIIISSFNIKVPQMIVDSLDFVGNTAPALSLFATGIFISQTKVFLNFEVSLLILIKNIISPIIFLFLMILFKIKGDVFNEILLVAAMPTASTAPMFSSKFSTYEAQTSSATILGTIFSALTLGGIIFFLQN